MNAVRLTQYPMTVRRRVSVSQPHDNSIESVINRAKHGDSDAITQLYETHVDKIYRYIAYRVPDTEAEDITSDVFINMVEGLKSYTYTGAPFEAWLYKIASARIADYYRKSKRTQHSELDERLSSDSPAPEDTLILTQEQQLIREKLHALGDDQQTLLLLRFVERKSHEEVAEIMGKTVNAVKVMQHRALTRLAKLMGQDKKERHYLRGENE